MSLTRQMALLIATLLVSACLGLWGLQLGSLRDALREQQRERNAAAALALAGALSPLTGDITRLREAMSTHAAAGSWRRVTVRSADGQALVELGASAGDGRQGVPDWFAGLVALDLEAARVALSGPDAGAVYLLTRDDWALQALWRSASRTALWLAALLALGLALGAWRLRRWQHPLRQVVDAAQALQEGRFQFIAEPRAADLKPVVKSMNALVGRLAEQYAAQSTQVHTLQRLAHADAITGLARRDAFLRRVADHAERPECVGLTLVIVRLRNLALLNEVVGHASVDGFLGAFGELLDDYPRRVNGALAGRLNGTDLALVLPAKGVARDTAEAIADTLAALAERSMPGLEFAIGAAETIGPMPLAHLLAACDTALARAEWRSQARTRGAAHGEIVVRLLGEADDGGDNGDAALSASGGSPTPRGSRGWRARISAALEAGRVDVAEYPVLDRQGRLIHFECPLRVQPEPDGPVLAAGEWLPWASRSALLPRLELAGLVKVLARIAADGQRRVLHLCESSIVQSGAVQALAAVLDEHTLAAPLLGIEIAEATWARAPAPLASLGAALRERGVEIGMEHAGQALPSKAFVQGIALAYVKVDARFVRDASDDPAARDLAAALVQQARSLGALAIAEGVASEAETAAMLELGFDGVTGPGVQLAG